MSNLPLYSRLDAFNEGFLQVADIHTIDYQQSGAEHFVDQGVRA